MGEICSPLGPRWTIKRAKVWPVLPTVLNWLSAVPVLDDRSRFVSRSFTLIVLCCGVCLHRSVGGVQDRLMGGQRDDWWCIDG